MSQGFSSGLAIESRSSCENDTCVYMVVAITYTMA